MKRQALPTRLEKWLLGSDLRRFSVTRSIGGFWIVRLDRSTLLSAFSITLAAGRSRDLRGAIEVALGELSERDGGRPAPRVVTMPRWTAGEVAILRKLYPDGTDEELEAQLPRRTLFSIKDKAHRTGLRRILRPRWTAGEVAILRKLYPDGTDEELEAQLPRRTLFSIKAKAHHSRVHRSHEHVRDRCSENVCRRYRKA